MKISVIVPIYKGEKYIQPVYEMVRKSVSALVMSTALKSSM